MHPDSSSKDLAALLLSALHEAEDPVEVPLVDVGPYPGVLLQGISDLQLLIGLLDEGLGERLDDGSVDEDPGRVGADLALVEEVRQHGRGHGAFEVGILEDDQLGLASQLQGHGFDVVCGRLPLDCLSTGHGSGEGHLTNEGMLADGCPCAGLSLQYPSSSYIQ